MFKDKQFIFTASWKISKIYERTLQSISVEKSLTLNEIDVLLYLHINPLDNTSKNIAKYRSISKSLICKSVSSLSSKNLISSAKDEEDARSYRLILTAEGQKIAKEIFDCCSLLCADLCWGISDDEMQYFLNLQEKLIENSQIRLKN